MKMKGKRTPEKRATWVWLRSRKSRVRCPAGFANAAYETADDEAAAEAAVVVVVVVANAVAGRNADVYRQGNNNAAVDDGAAR